MTYTAQHIFDALPSPRDIRDHRLMAVNAALIPDIIDLPDVPILDQGAEGACVGHGCAGAREVLEVIASGASPVIPLSRAFIYYMARQMEGSQNEDAGAFVRDGCKVLNNIGVCTEDLFPYTPGRFKDVPPDLDIVKAADYKIGSFARLNSSTEVRAALAMQMPVVIGVSVFQSFEQDVKGDGFIPMPGASDQELGGHCMYVRGARPDPRAVGKYIFKTPNSWGLSFGENGIGWFSEDYFNNPNYTSDLWSITL